MSQACHLKMRLLFEVLTCLVIGVVAATKSHWSNSNIYVIGTAKDVAQHLPYLKKNINAVTSLFQSHKIFIYSHKNSVQDFQSWRKENSNVKILVQKYEHPSRTDRLAYGRNELMKTVHADSSKSSHLKNSLLLILDFDEVNVQPINIQTFRGAIDRSSEWEMVSFHRPYFYDIWSLRYERFNINIWNFGTKSLLLRDIIEADIVSLLDTSNPSFLPVYSVFNGLAVYKLPMTVDCLYNGSNSEVFAPDTIYGASRISVKEDCEHVSFHLCMSKKHDARIRIYSQSLF